MNWLDIVILIIIVIATVMGIKAGIIKVLFTLVGGIVGVILAGRFSDSLGSKLTFMPESTAKILAFAIILIVVMVLAAILAAVLTKIVSTVLLGWVNRLGGGILGFVLGAIFCGALATMWVKFQGGSDAVTGSALARFIIDRFPVVLGLLPSDFKSVKDFFQ